MQRNSRTVPGWDDVLEAFQKIKGDPDLLDPVKDILLLLLIRSIPEGDYWNITSNCKSLKKYGVVVKIPILRSGNALLDKERFRVLRRQHQAEEEKKIEKTDWPEAIALARVLDLLSEKMGTDSDVKNFLYKFKVLLWHYNIQSCTARLRIVFTYGKKHYRIWAVWCMLQQQKFNSLPDGQFYSLSVPPDLISIQRMPRLITDRECHNSISSGQLNVFALYAMSSDLPLTKIDFWGIMNLERIDFLEFLLADLPDKKLPYSMDEIIATAVSMTGNSEYFAVKILQLVERVAPGKIASFTDQYGGNWLWYSLFMSSRKNDVTPGGAVILSPIQSFLYGLCDHATPNCDGISFDDLFHNYPIQFLK